MSFIDKLKLRYQTGTIVEKLIYINVAVFAFTLLISVFQGLYKGQANFLMQWFSLESDFNAIFSKPWSIISYGFLHAGFLHLLLNMIVMYFIGNLFVQYFTQKQLLNFYLLGTFFGGALYLVSQNYFPLFEGQASMLVGASAGISAIFMGIATYIPNNRIHVRFIGPVKLWYLAAIWIALDVVGLIGGNAGGHFAHLGGALFGFLYVNQASNKEIGIFDQLFSFFKKKKTPLKTVHKNPKNYKKPATNSNLNQQQIDKILDKISKSGYDTLTKAEKEFLFKQGKK